MKSKRGDGRCDFWKTVGKVAEYKCLDSRTMWVTLEFDGVVVSVYALGIEKMEDKWKDFGQGLTNT